MRDLYGLVIGKLGSGSFDVAPLNELLPHSLVGRPSINAKSCLNLRKQNATQKAVLLSSGRLFVFGCHVCVCHRFLTPPEEKSECLGLLAASYQPLISQSYFLITQLR